MRGSRFLISLLVAGSMLALASCGGGDGSPPDPTFRVEATVMPEMLSGQPVTIELPIVGGCGGPYLLQVIEGTLPDGLRLDNETHSIVGTLLVDGEFSFTVLVTDRGCDPFLTTTSSFQMSVGVGEITVVDVTRGGEPIGLVPVGEGFNPAAPDDPTYNPDYPALPAAIFNEFVVLDLVVAGGHGPYSMQISGDQSLPEGDAQLPLGDSIIPKSTSISGAAVEEKSPAFLYTFEITDSRGVKGYFTCNWLVYSPPLLIELSTPDAGQAGVDFTGFTPKIAGGVPPFVHEMTDAMDSTTRMTAADYPSGPSGDGSNYDQTHPGVLSEGMWIEEDFGTFLGTPRRRGTYKVFYHCYSPALVQSPLQNVWSEYGFQIADSVPVVQSPAYTLEGSFTTTSPYSRIADAMQYVPYSCSLQAENGVPADGYTDAPHSTERAQDPTEEVGYRWTMDWDPDDDLAGTGEIDHMELVEEQGIFQTVVGEEDLLVPQLYQNLEFTASDLALPPSTVTTKAEKVRFSIGPDRIVLTQSSTSYTTATSYDNRRMNDTAMTVKVAIPQSTGGLSVNGPGDADLVGTGADKIGVPPEANNGTTATPVATLLTNIDLCRVSVNPTGWWDDTNHLNPNAARPFQHSDSNAVYAYYRSLGYAGSTSYLGSSYSSSRYQVQPVATCLRLPKCTTTGVQKDKAKGVYTDGGKLYVFDSSAYFGIFIVRSDGRLYVPAAFHKSTTGWRNFGDNWTEGYKSPGSANSINKIPQMTVSPDGRFGAFKLKSSTSYSRTEYADDSAIVLISLTGERISEWGDEVYKIIDTGSDGSSSQGYYQFASSLTLTNRYLYYLIGSGSTTYLHFKDHYIYRYDLFGGDDEGDFLHSNHNSEWTNSAGNAMQTPFQMFNRNFQYSTGCDPQMVHAHGHNAYESSLAPHPFRVSANGRACAIIASRRTSSTTYGWEIRWNHVWVDYDGELHQISNQRRHHRGGGRGIQLTNGPNYSSCAYQWGHHDGPTSRFEISDDGLRVASVYRRYRNTTSSSYLPYGNSSYSTTMYRYRQDVVAYTTTATNPWDASTVHEITGDTSTNYYPSSAKFRTSTQWRFGALTFTAEGDGLVFYGGYSNYSPTQYSMGNTYQYYAAQACVGSIYSYQFSNSAVKNILSSTNGGASFTVGSTLTSISVSSSSWQSGGGVIKPIGGWVSPNHHFLYIINKGALHSSSGSRRDGAVLGFNIRSLDSSRSINTSTSIARTDGRGYLVTGLDTTNGFYPVQYYIAGYGIGYYYYSSLMQQNYQSFGDSERAAATDNGWVYFISEKSVYGYSSTYASSAYGGCINQTYYTYNYLTKHLYMFDQNLGGNINKLAGDEWSGSSSYHVVGYIDVSDDGATVSAVDSTARYYDWNGSERLTVWSGVELNATGGLVGTPTKNQYESGVHVGSTSTFTPQKDRVIYAAGGGNENAKKLKYGPFGTNTPVDYGQGASNYNVLHAGR